MSESDDDQLTPPSTDEAPTVSGYTSHGWPFGPNPPVRRPTVIAKCGGPGTCGHCKAEIVGIQEAADAGHRASRAALAEALSGTTMPADQFDALTATLDEPDPALRLAQAAAERAELADLRRRYAKSQEAVQEVLADRAPLVAERDEIRADRDHQAEMLRQARDIHVQDRQRAASSLQERDEVVRQLVELQEDNDRLRALVNTLTEHVPDYYAGDPLAVIAEWAADIASGDPERVRRARGEGEYADEG